MKRYKIDSVFDLDGNPKEQRIWGTERILLPYYSDQPPCLLGLPVNIAYAGGYGVRKTSTLQAYTEFSGELFIVTLNSVYMLTEIYEDNPSE